MSNNYNKIIGCPRCKKMMMEAVLINDDQRKGKAKNDKYHLVCDNCSYRMAS